MGRTQRRPLLRSLLGGSAIGMGLYFSRPLTVRAETRNPPPFCSLLLQEMKEPARTDDVPVQNLAIKGGGPKGIAYIGALEVLEEKGLLNGVKRVSGASAGAITAALLSVGYTPKEIKGFLKEKDAQGRPRTLSFILGENESLNKALIKLLNVASNSAFPMLDTLGVPYLGSLLTTLRILA